jgi:hypothetical protein
MKINIATFMVVYINSGLENVTPTITYSELIVSPFPFCALPSVPF